MNQPRATVEQTGLHGERSGGGPENAGEGVPLAVRSRAIGEELCKHQADARRAVAQALSTAAEN